MQEFLRWLAAWKGIAVEDGAELHFEFSSFPAGGLGFMVLVGLLLALAFVVFVYRRDGKKLRTWQRVVLGALRMVAVLAAVLLLLEPNLVAIKRETRPGHTLLLLDTSQSMTHLDAWRRDDVQEIAAAWRSLGVPDPASATRMDMAKALLGWHDGELVKKLAAHNLAQLYGFGGSIEALPLVPPPPLPQDAPPADTPPPPPQLDLAKIEADGRFSNLGGSLRTALEKSRSSEIAAVVVLSDGRRNVGPQGAEVARLLNQRKVPQTYVLGIGDPSETQTVGLSRFEAPEKVFQSDPFTMRANVESQGYDLTSVTVKLVRVNDKGSVQPVRSQQVTIGGNKPQAEIEFADLTSDETGRFAYRVELVPPDGEPPSAERHSKSAMVEVLAQRTRVLLIAGGANFEYQILRNLLIRDKTIDVSCWLQSADADFPQDGDEDVRIDKLPEDRAQLDVYDVVIMIDPDSTKLSPSFCAMLRQQVENGCGLWWVCGEKFTLNSIRPGAPTQPVVELLPVTLDVRKADYIYELSHAFPQAWPYQLTPEGEAGMAAKIAKIAENKDESRLLWGRLPGLHLAFPVLRPKPTATVIVEDTDPAWRQGDHGMALIATQFVGAGRVLFTGTDETYRWRSLYENAYDRFWVNGIRYLFEGRVTAGNSRMRLLVSDEKLELGEAVKLAAEAKDEGFHPLVVEGIDVMLERDGRNQETLHLLPVAEAPGKYELTLRPTATGFYRARSVQKYGREVEATFQVVPAQIESEGPVDRAELAAVAGCNGGVLCQTPQQLLAALDQIPSRSATDTFRTPHAVWDGWATVAVMLVALSLEWYLRKRFNLL